MGKDLRLAAIESYFVRHGLPGTPAREIWSAVPKGMAKKVSDSTSDDGDDSDDDDSDDDATDADTDDESDEDQDDSESDDDDDEDDDAEDDDESEDDGQKSKRKPGFKAPKSQAELDELIAKRLDRKAREVEAQVKADLKRQNDLAAAKKRGDSDKVIKALEDEIASLKEANKETSLAEVRRRVAEKAGLPSSAAARLVGKNEAELRADAKVLRKELGITGKPADKKPDDRGESNKSRSTKSKNDEQADWKKPEFWITD